MNSNNVLKGMNWRTDLSTSSSKSGPNPAVFDDVYVINYLMTMWSTDEMGLSYSRAHTLSTSLSTSSSKSGPKLSVFFPIFIWNRALATVSCRFCRPHLQKVQKKPVSVLRCLCETELSLQSRAHFVDHFPDRGAQPRKQRPSSGEHGRPLYPKKTQGFAPESVFSREFTRSRSLTLPNYLHMLWLTWWCGCHDDWDDDVVCHDGETASHWQASADKPTYHRSVHPGVVRGRRRVSSRTFRDNENHNWLVTWASGLIIQD